MCSCRAIIRKKQGQTVHQSLETLQKPRPWVSEVSQSNRLSKATGYPFGLRNEPLPRAPSQAWAPSQVYAQCYETNRQLGVVYRLRAATRPSPNGLPSLSSRWLDGTAAQSGLGKCRCTRMRHGRDKRRPLVKNSKPKNSYPAYASPSGNLHVPAFVFYRCMIHCQLIVQTATNQEIWLLEVPPC